MRVVFTPLAERQIDALHDYITKHASEERADGYVGRIVAICEGFSTFPERGTRRDDVLPGLRVTGFERRVTIAFVLTAEAVLIEGMFYGGQDFEAALRAHFRDSRFAGRSGDGPLASTRPSPDNRASVSKGTRAWPASRAPSATSPPATSKSPSTPPSPCSARCW